MMEGFLVIVGESASGKSALASALKKKGYRQMKSYTTRPRRDENDNDYVFVTEEQFDRLPNRNAEVEMRGYRYCTDLNDVDKCDFKILEPSGLVDINNNYNGGKVILSLLITTPELERVRRLKDERGLSEAQVQYVLSEDDKKFRNLDKNLINITVSNYTAEDFDAVVEVACEMLESLRK